MCNPAPSCINCHSRVEVISLPPTTTTMLLFSISEEGRKSNRRNGSRVIMLMMLVARIFVGSSFVVFLCVACCDVLTTFCLGL